eukprot:CAMPEP_0183715212 /NCGR_PEP_ID=MMETSP0737-20130205/9539_1 /TAXON_ID=385413 /ORGANISM="Thalassiosira miniscula, Strain CCMP1093" /LENGTH=718 /DNA_ID=CAMNT_0025944301 /DNA_START=357 /DNA_END=2513 /DNA_ORIENTATION=-
MMMETSSSAIINSSFLTSLSVGLEVNIESRTWAGINKPGGHAVITQIHRDEATHAIISGVDVKYVLGGRESNVELTYVKPHAELERRGRSRRKDVKMNLESLGGAENDKKKKKKKASSKKQQQSKSTEKKGKKDSATKGGKEGGKKRKALASIDKNGGEQKKDDVSNKSAKKSHDSSHNKTALDGDKKAEKGADRNAGIPTEGVAILDETTAAGADTDLGELDEHDGTWTLIQDGKMADYTSILTKNTRISYWWSDEDGWLRGKLTKCLSKVVTASKIRWTVRVHFDNGDDHTLDFHPKEKRWKVFECSEKELASDATDAGAKALEKKKCAAKKSKAAKEKAAKENKNKKDGKKSTKKAAAVEKGSQKTKAAEASAKSTDKTNATQTQAKPATFGPELQSKIKEMSSKMHAAAKNPSSSNDTGLVRYSPNSILAVRAAHARISTSANPHQSTKKQASHSTQSIGFSSSLPPGTLSPDDSRRKHSRDMEDRRTRESKVQMSLIRLPEEERVAKIAAGNVKAKKANDSSKAGKTTNTITTTTKAPQCTTKSTGKVASTLKNEAKPKNETKPKNDGKKKPPKTTLQSMIARESTKANKFVDYMTGHGGPSSNASTTAQSAAAAPATLSQESVGEEDDLELKIDQERIKLFNTILTEIMFRQRLDMMDVEEMMEKINDARTTMPSCRPFTLLEVKPYLQKLHDDSKIFMVEEEGNMGVIYSI